MDPLGQSKMVSVMWFLLVSNDYALEAFVTTTLPPIVHLAGQMASFFFAGVGYDNVAVRSQNAEVNSQNEAARLENEAVNSRNEAVKQTSVP